MSVQDDGNKLWHLHLFIFFVAFGVPAATATAAIPARTHLRQARHDSVSLVESRLRRKDRLKKRQAMGRAVAHGGHLFMNTAAPGEIWVLTPDYDHRRWEWKPGGSVYTSLDPGAPVNLPSRLAFPREAPAPGGAPAAGGAAPGPAPGPAPGVAGVTCSQLIAKAEQTKGAQGMFLNCQEFRYYGTGPFGKSQPYGCHCASWTVNCPFETCPVGTAFDAACLADDVKKMGFTSLSKLSNYVNPASVPKQLRPYTVHPDYISTCMYWLPKPPNPGLPVVNSEAIANYLPDFATFYFDGISLVGCADQISDEGKLATTKSNLLRALGQTSLTVMSITCGSMSALITGPKGEIDAAAKLSAHPNFCWQAVSLQVCTGGPAPAPAAFAGAPGPAPGGPAGPSAPGPAPGGSPAPGGAPGPAPGGAPGPAPGGAPGPSPGGAPGGAPGPAPGGAPGPSPGPAPAR